MFNDTHLMIRQSAKDFAQKVCLPTAIERDENQKYGKDEIKQLHQLGFMSMIVPEEYGGAGLDYKSYVLALEEISKVDASIAVCMSVNNSLVCNAILADGNDDQKKKYLSQLSSRGKTGAFLLSEPEAGSDAKAIKTFAKKDGDNFIINGIKNWITNGSSAGIYIVFAKISQDNDANNICAFIIDRETDGITIAKKENKLGIRSSDTNSIGLQDVKISSKQMLGKVGEGFKIAMQTLEKGRIGIAAQALGIAQGALDLSIQYCKIRKAFGKEIAKLQTIQNKIAEMHTKTEAARLLVYKAANDYDNGNDISLSGSTAKLHASRTAVEVTSEAIQIHGGNGYVKDYHVERMYRDAKITEIYEGTSEIQKLIISRKLLVG